MNLIKCFQTHSTWYKKAARNSTPIGILWHDTAGGNPYLKRYVQPYETDDDYDNMMTLLGKNKYNNDWNHIDHEAGLNAWIGKLADESIATIQAGEWDIHPWGCGGGNKGSCNGYTKATPDSKSIWGNQHWIQFEICDDNYGNGKNTKEYFDSVYKEACEFTAYICKLYNINPLGTVLYNGINVPTILCHADSYKLGLGGNHGDVYSWFKKYGYTMDNVREDVNKILLSSVVPEQKTENESVDYSLFKEGTLVSIRNGATYYSGKSIPSWVMNQNWVVYQNATSDRIVINKSENGKSAIMSPINAKFLDIVKTTYEEPEIAIEVETPIVDEQTNDIPSEKEPEEKEVEEPIVDDTTNEIPTKEPVVETDTQEPILAEEKTNIIEKIKNIIFELCKLIIKLFSKN